MKTEFWALEYGGLAGKKWGEMTKIQLLGLSLSQSLSFLICELRQIICDKLIPSSQNC